MRKQANVEFLSWQRPGLVSACEHIVGRSASSHELDLSRVAIVVPGGRVGRNLRALLVERAASERKPLSPPRVVTPGGIPDLVLGLRGRFAGTAASRLAWAEAMWSMPREELQPLVPHPPERDDLRGWLALGDMLRACQSELAAGMLLFGEVPEACAGAEGFLEHDRWTAAAAVQHRYREILRVRGLLDTDLERIEALRAAAPVAADDCPEIFLVGVNELSAVARAALGLAGKWVTALVFADESLRDRFDELGCPRVDAWANSPMGVRDDQIAFADAPTDQAEAALVAIARLGGALSADQIAIGIADEELVPFLERRAEIAGGPGVRYAGGRPARHTGPWRLLAAISEQLKRGDFSSLRGLVRHPDVEWWLRRTLYASASPPSESWLQIMDDYAAESLHGRMNGEWHTQGAVDRNMLTRVSGAVESLMTPLRDNGTARRSVSDWAEQLLAVLNGVYAHPSPQDSPAAARLLFDGCTLLRDAIDELRLLEGTATKQWPHMTAEDALWLVMQHTADQAIPAETDADSIEMLGWLELPLDPSEAIVVVGMNEARIPASFGADPFLSEGLRERLGIANARQRYARDACVLTSLLRSRKSVTLVAGRRTAAGDPLWPSRLLVAQPLGELPHRVLRFLGKAPATSRPPTLAAKVRSGAVSGFPIAPIAAKPAIDSMRVTSFRTYLASPYLFYLEHVLRLTEAGDPDGELDPISFGVLVHDVLKHFGKSAVRHSSDVRKIEECLFGELGTLAVRRFGVSPGAAVSLQIEIAKRRLRAVARWQAQRVRDGWLIAETEWEPVKAPGVLTVDGQPMRLRGRIDRIERHEQTGVLAILDFKTGDTAKRPEQTHQSADGWKDLQLPLYRHVAAELGAGDDTVLGYVVIPSDLEKVGLLTAEWSPADLADADSKAAEVIRAVREGKFEEVGEGTDAGTVFAALCGTGFLGGEDEEGEDQ